MNRTDRRTIAWLTTLDASAVAGSLLFACMMPFVAVATAAALTLPRAAGVLTVMVAWAINQAIGFGLLGYPLEGTAMLHGVGIAAAALAAFAIARIGRTAGGSLSLARAGAAFLLAFAGYELTLYAFALWLGGAGNFTPAIVWMIGRNDALWFAGLMALHALLTRAAPGWFGAPARLRLA